jgi:hypothetical protein
MPTTPGCFRLRATRWLYSPLWYWDDCQPPQGCGDYQIEYPSNVLQHLLFHPGQGQGGSYQINHQFNIWVNSNRNPFGIYFSTTAQNFSPSGNTFAIEESVSTTQGIVRLSGEITYSGTWGNLTSQHELRIIFPDVPGNFYAKSWQPFQMTWNPSGIQGSMPKDETVYFQCMQGAQYFSSSFSDIERAAIENPINDVNLE